MKPYWVFSDGPLQLQRKALDNLNTIAGGGIIPPTDIQQTGLVALVAGTQSYAVVFAPAFASAPSFFGAEIQMPSSSGETFEAVVDRSSLTASGITVWLSGVPTAASAGGKINWIANL